MCVCVWRVREERDDNSIAFQGEILISRLEELPHPLKVLTIFAANIVNLFQGRCIESAGNLDVEILLLFTGSKHVTLSRAVKLNIVRYCNFFGGIFFKSPLS